MLLILLGWAIVAALVCGIGMGVARLLDGAADFRLTECLWLGWAAVLTILQWWQLALPVDYRALLVLVVAASMGAFFGWRGQLFRPRVDLLILIPLALGLAALATQPPNNGDSGFYHRPIVTWFRDFRLVPGLGNLCLHYALASAHFLFQALLDEGPWRHRSHHLGASFIVLMGLASLVAAVRAGWPRRVATVWAAPILGCAIVDQALGVNVSSDSPDLPVAVVGVVVLLMLAELCTVEPPRRPALLIGVITIAGVGVSVKLSFLALGVLAVAAAAAASIDVVRSERRTCLKALVIPSFAVIGHGIREFVLSGWPLFPSAAFSLPASWAMSPRLVQGHEDYVRAWGRWSGGPIAPVLSGWEWVRPWAVANLTQNRFVFVPLFVGVIALIIALLIPNGRVLLRRSWPIVAVPLGSLAFWFFTSPDVRFAGAAFWGFAAGSVSLAASAFQPTVWAARAMVFLGCLLAAYPILNARLPSVDPWSLDPLPQPQSSAYTTRSGLELRVPIKLCWDLPPPCTPFPRPDLSLRDGRTLTSGFVVGEDPGSNDEALIAGPNAEVPVVR
jgi:hypothetical protein